MSLGTSLAGVITFFLGLAGLLDYYGHPVLPFSLTVVSVLFTPAGTLLLFGFITVIGVGLIVGGFVEGEEETKLTVRDVQKLGLTRKEVAVVPAGNQVLVEALSELDVVILRCLSQGKDEKEISKLTGVSRVTITEKMTKLYAHGYITEEHSLTEKGFEALRRAEPPPVPQTSG
jgi:DNA-binding CsgD family transcriptional regulator